MAVSSYAHGYDSVHPPALRTREHVQNPVNLADPYRLTGNRERASMIPDETRSITPLLRSPEPTAFLKQSDDNVD
ncbi:MAG: hypothetical protein KDK30_16685 [Leptospiraceae bacterium]|nr:hypothetical protein [Leptospiraceae bacterium]MCB1317973.1 hypothetical protein [Leptospiraceae bacterium]